MKHARAFPSSNGHLSPVHPQTRHMNQSNFFTSCKLKCALWGLCIKGDATKKRYHSGRADTEDLHIRPSPTSPSCQFVSCSHYLQLQSGTEMSNGAVFLNQPALICKFECSFNLPASIKNAERGRHLDSQLMLPMLSFPLLSLLILHIQKFPSIYTCCT